MSATYEQTPSPQEIQFAGVLQMGVQELRDYVETALQENPVFELSDPGEEMLEDPNFPAKQFLHNPAAPARRQPGPAFPDGILSER